MSADATLLALREALAKIIESGDTVLDSVTGDTFYAPIIEAGKVWSDSTETAAAIEARIVKPWRLGLLGIRSILRTAPGDDGEAIRQALARIDALLSDKPESSDGR